MHFELVASNLFRNKRNTVELQSKTLVLLKKKNIFLFLLLRAHPFTKTCTTCVPADGCESLASKSIRGGEHTKKESLSTFIRCIIVSASWCAPIPPSIVQRNKKEKCTHERWIVYRGREGGMSHCLIEPVCLFFLMILLPALYHQHPLYRYMRVGTTQKGKHCCPI